MSKEIEAYMKEHNLTPLKAFQKYRDRDIKDFAEFTWIVKIIEIALKEHELMKNTKIIVAGKKISDSDFEKLKNQRMLVDSLEQCEIKLLDERNEKLEKAWEIVLKKEVNIADFRESILSFGMTYKHYVNNQKNYSWELLTETEFNLIKEILEEK